MKTFAIALFMMLGSSSIFAQKDPALVKRLEGLVQATEAMDFEKILFYTYPKLFTIVPKDKMLEALKNTIGSEEMTVKFDSLKIDSLYPVFTVREGKYAKINASMKMIMKFAYPAADSTAENKKQFDETMRQAMETQFGADKVSAESNGGVAVMVDALMVAVKDQYAKEWCFVNLKEKDPLTPRLFSKEVTDKLATYK